tara:strand:- start:500 stop:1699 length:1200 start_codon:yes stop_codon:yes gene_type:complete
MIKKGDIHRKDRWIFCGFDVVNFLQKNPEIKNHKRILLRAYPGIALLFIYGILRVSHLYLMQKKYDGDPEVHNHLVLETDESHMHQNYFKFCNPDKSIPFTMIKAFDNSSYTAISWISLSELMKALVGNLKGFKKNVEYLPPAFFNLLFRKAVSSIAVYTYWFALFSKINISRPSTKLFSSGPYIPGCAAAAAGIETIYIAHGFIQNFFANPAYSSVMVYSDEECLEYQRYLGHKQITLFPISEIKDLNQSILIFLSNTDIGAGMETEDLLELVKFFQKRKYKIIIKTHPYNSESKILQQLSKIYDIEMNSDKLLTGFQAIQRYKPKFTASWASTTACESLRSGVIPISLTKITHIAIHGSVYPQDKRNFYWDTEKNEIEQATIDRENYIASLKLVRFR